MNTNPIYIISEDQDDHEFLQHAWDGLDYPNELKFFESAKDALDELKSGDSTPFLIVCDLELSKMNGFDLKEELMKDKKLSKISIPFIFLSETSPPKQIAKTYENGINGFFVKGSSTDEFKKTLVEIVEYWQNSRTPEVQ